MKGLVSFLGITMDYKLNWNQYNNSRLKAEKFFFCNVCSQHKSFETCQGVYFAYVESIIQSRDQVVA